jgi:hypothetical protein
MHTIVKSNTSFFFSCLHKKWFQVLPLQYSTDVRWQLICCDILKFQLMSQLLQTNKMLFFDMMERHHTSTMQWQHSWIGTCLSDGLAVGGTSWPLWSPVLTPSWLFHVGLCERWGLCSANDYDPEQIEGSDMNCDWKNLISLYCKMLDTNFNIVLMCAGQQTMHILNLHGV